VGGKPGSNSRTKGWGGGANRTGQKTSGGGANSGKPNGNKSVGRSGLSSQGSASHKVPVLKEKKVDSWELKNRAKDTLDRRLGKVKGYLGTTTPRKVEIGPKHKDKIKVILN